MNVSRIALAAGYNDLQTVIRWLDHSDIDVLAVGETREWEGVEYARDAVTAGRQKALIILGHVPSEERGMQECARWLKTFIPEVPIEYLPSGEPFWSPKPASGMAK